MSWAASVGPVCGFDFAFDALVSEAAPADSVPVAPLILPRPNPGAAAAIAPPQRRKVNWSGRILSYLPEHAESLSRSD